MTHGHTARGERLPAAVAAQLAADSNGSPVYRARLGHHLLRALLRLRSGAGEDVHTELRGRQGHGSVLNRPGLQHVGIWASLHCSGRQLRGQRQEFHRLGPSHQREPVQHQHGM
jgi:hypothetical protein